MILVEKTNPYTGGLKLWPIIIIQQREENLNT